MDPDTALLLDVLEAVQAGADNDRDEAIRRALTDHLNAAISALNEPDADSVVILDGLEKALTSATATFQASSSLGGKAAKKTVNFSDKGKERSRSTSPSRPTSARQACYWRVAGRQCPKGRDCRHSHDDKVIKEFKAAMGKEPKKKENYEKWKTAVDTGKPKSNSATASKPNVSAGGGRVTLGSFTAVLRGLHPQQGQAHACSYYEMNPDDPTEKAARVVPTDMTDVAKEASDGADIEPTPGAPVPLRRGCVGDRSPNLYDPRAATPLTAHAGKRGRCILRASGALLKPPGLNGLAHSAASA
jgi:hypothetical protein